MIVKLLSERHLEFLSLKRGCRGSSESKHVKMPHFWKSHALAKLILTDGRWTDDGYQRITKAHFEPQTQMSYKDPPRYATSYSRSGSGVAHLDLGKTEEFIGQFID